jgi:hypothetical protein
LPFGNLIYKNYLNNDDESLKKIKIDGISLSFLVKNDLVEKFLKNKMDINLSKEVTLDILPEIMTNVSTLHNFPNKITDLNKIFDLDLISYQPDIILENLKSRTSSIEKNRNTSNVKESGKIELSEASLMSQLKMSSNLFSNINFVTPKEQVIDTTLESIEHTPVEMTSIDEYSIGSRKIPANKRIGVSKTISNPIKETSELEEDLDIASLLFDDYVPHNNKSDDSELEEKTDTVIIDNDDIEEKSDVIPQEIISVTGFSGLSGLLNMQRMLGDKRKTLSITEKEKVNKEKKTETRDKKELKSPQVMSTSGFSGLAGLLEMQKNLKSAASPDNIKSSILTRDSDAEYKIEDKVKIAKKESLTETANILSPYPFSFSNFNIEPVDEPTSSQQDTGVSAVSRINKTDKISDKYNNPNVNIVKKTEKNKKIEKNERNEKNETSIGAQFDESTMKSLFNFGNIGNVSHTETVSGDSDILTNKENILDKGHDVPIISVIGDDNNSITIHDKHISENTSFGKQLDESYLLGILSGKNVNIGGTGFANIDIVPDTNLNEMSIFGNLSANVEIISNVDVTNTMSGITARQMFEDYNSLMPLRVTNRGQVISERQLESIEFNRDMFATLSDIDDEELGELFEFPNETIEYEMSMSSDDSSSDSEELTWYQLVPSTSVIEGTYNYDLKCMKSMLNLNEFLLKVIVDKDMEDMISSRKDLCTIVLLVNYISSNLRRLKISKSQKALVRCLLYSLRGILKKNSTNLYSFTENMAIKYSNEKISFFAIKAFENKSEALYISQNSPSIKFENNCLNCDKDLYYLSAPLTQDDLDHFLSKGFRDFELSRSTVLCNIVNELIPRFKKTEFRLKGNYGF